MGRQRRDEASKEMRWVVVVLVEGEPGEGETSPGIRCTPLAQQGGFPKPGRGGNEGQGAGQSLGQARSEALARDEVGPRGREVELGGEEGGPIRHSWPLPKPILV